MTMTMSSVLDDIRSVTKTGMQKSASAKTQPEKADTVKHAEQELLKALTAAVQSTEKTAAVAPEKQASAVDSLVKMASDLAQTEQQALVKEAHLYGAAVADGFVARLNQYDQSLDAAGVKTASAESFIPSEEEFTKFAEANPQAVQQAMEQGYRDTMARVQHVKVAAHAQDNANWLKNLVGSSDSLQKIAGAGQSYADTTRIIDQMSTTPDGQQKLAEIRQGFNDTYAEIEKIAGDCYSRGFEDTVRLMENYTRG